MNPEYHNVQVFADIEKQVNTQHYGSINLTLEVFQDKIVGIQGQQFQKVKFKEGENAEAASLLLSEIKELHDAKVSGMFTFTIKMFQGDIKDVYLQRNLKKQYQLEKKE